jgi:MFS transporter, ACS family, hexuronate transporter
MTEAASLVQKAGRYRWTIVALLFFATLVNYIDRNMLGLLKSDLSKELGWSDDDYGNIVTAFQAAYALGFLVMGRLIDKYGPKIGYAIAIVIWTIGHVMHGIPELLKPVAEPIAYFFAPLISAIKEMFGGDPVTVVSAGLIAVSFMLARVVLGIGEAGHFPAVIRSSSEWFPQKERSYAIGWVNSATTIGVILTAPTLWLMMEVFKLDWRETFVYTGLFGVILLALWWFIYANPRQSAKVSDAELAWIEHDPPEKVEQVGWGKLVLRKEAWAFAIAKFLTDPVWFLMLFWLPSYFKTAYGVSFIENPWPLIAMYLISDVGSIMGGWFSSKLIQSGRSVNFARKATMLAAGCFVLPLLIVSQVNTMWLAVFLIGLALAGHQAFSSNLLSIPPDMFPKRAVGSVIGLGGFMGGVGGMIMAKSTGLVLETTGGNYSIIFAVCTAVYFIAVACIHTLSPHLARAEGL